MADKKLYGLIGYPVKHSFSAAMHNAAFLHLGMNAEYKLFEVKPEDLEEFLLSRKDVSGFNVTIPHKVRAKGILESNFPYNKEAEFIQQNLFDAILTGAVNTVKRIEEKLEYYNTDAGGFIKALEEDLQFELGGVQKEDKKVFLFGCGGAGRAVIAGLSWENHRVEKICVYDKSEKSANSLKEHFLTLSSRWQRNLVNKIEFLSEKQISEKIEECNLLVNASPVGMEKGDGSIIDKELLHSKLSVYDVVYNRETQLIKDAKEKGLPAAGGLKMLLYQGVIAFEIWTEQKAPVNVMFEALESELKKC